MFFLYFLVLFQQGDHSYIINENGEDYIVHTYTSIGIHEFRKVGFISHVDVLIVGGGGGGGSSGGGSDPGGGGSGGLVFKSNHPIEILNTIVVGNGGSIHKNGENSQFNDLIALGGGFGGSDH